MVNLQKSGNSAVKFVFTDSDHYLYGNGVVDVPVNSLLLVIDESDMVTFKKLSGDPFLSFRADNSNLGTKAAIEQFYKDNMVGSTGGGSESGITPSEVQEMIDESISGKADTSVVNQAISEASQAILSVSGDVQTKVATSDFNTYSAATDSRLAEDEEVTAAALNDLQENKADTSAVTAVNDALTAHTSNTGIHVTSADKTAWNNKSDFSGDYNDLTNKPTIPTVPTNISDFTNDAGYITNADITGKADTSAVTAAIDAAISGKVDTSAVTAAINNVKAYYINFATLTTQGITDADWDGIVAAINAHRPIYAGLPGANGLLYYTAECLYQDGNNTIKMTASDHNSHYFYTFVKNGSNDYSYTVSTKPYVPDITTAITSGSTDSEIPTAKATYDAIQAGGGGGATYSAGTNISIDTANTINCTLNLRNGTLANSLTGVQGVTNAQNSFAFGQSSTAGTSTGDEYAFAFGFNCKGRKGRSFAYGATVDVKEIDSAAFGTNITLKAPRSFAAGYHNVTNNWANIALGEELTTNNRPEFATGAYNNSVNDSTTSGQTLFSVGNGTSSARHNAFEIRQNGDIYVNDGTNDVRLQDTILALGGLKLVKLTQAEYDALATKDSSTLYIVSNVVS